MIISCNTNKCVNQNKCPQQLRDYKFDNSYSAAVVSIVSWSELLVSVITIHEARVRWEPTAVDDDDDEQEAFFKIWGTLKYLIFLLALRVEKETGQPLYYELKIYIKLYIRKTRRTFYTSLIYYLVCLKIG